MKTKNIFIIAITSLPLLFFVIVLCVSMSNYSAKQHVLHRWTMLLHNEKAASAMANSLEAAARDSGFSIEETSKRAVELYSSGYTPEEAAPLADAIQRGIKETE